MGSIRDATAGPRGARSLQCRSNNPPNPIKRFNNWNMCFSCGFDVPIWHTSKTCSPQCHRQGHPKEVDCKNAQAYKDAGRDVCMAKKMKTQLPINPGPHQA